MKILLLSDTHGLLYKVYEIYEKLNQIDLIVHCGDDQKDAYALEDKLGIPVISVKGNCDYGIDEDDTCPDVQFVDTPGGRLFVTHGHVEDVPSDYSKLLRQAEENGCIAVCFGHTHVPMCCTDSNGIWMINPGSLTLPRDDTGGSFAIIHSTEESFNPHVIFYDTVCGLSKIPDEPDIADDQEIKGNQDFEHYQELLQHIKEFQEKQNAQKKKKAKGGFLRNLLNNSDRF